ncbi:contractile injection system tape measure protein [Mangrovivirga cuniculi]|uniref:Uncharacterized protein n=1 Tax=Mangrovivirga cuniculi TaxID=2715131 RepID=A0A4D7JRR6_9BACT|nr:contractile injection system tape measure protein [Mangrovivirga cuniculi]QCK14536.1 hypothetical protein DCC35_07160 [Mangrovivirga cuniculi]
MEDGHVLRTSVFEISSDTSENSHDIHNSLNDIIQEDLNRLLEEIFDEFCPPGHRISIKKLELDLGDINQYNFESEFKSKLKDALRLHLRRLIDEHKFSENITIDQNYEESLIPDLLENYLDTGNLPWFSSSFLSNGESFFMLIKELVINDVDSIRKIVNKKLNNEAASHRLYRIFPGFNEWIEFSFSISNNHKAGIYKKSWIDFVEFIQNILPLINKELLNRLSGFVVISLESSIPDEKVLWQIIEQLLSQIHKERPDLFSSTSDLAQQIIRLKTVKRKKFFDYEVQIISILDDVAKRGSGSSKGELIVSGSVYSFEKLKEISKSISLKNEFIRKISLIELKRFIDKEDSSLSIELGGLFNLISEVNVPHLDHEKLVFFLKESIVIALFTKINSGSNISIQKIINDFLELLAKKDQPLRKYILFELLEKVEKKAGTGILYGELINIKNEILKEESFLSGDNDLKSVIRKFFLLGVLNESDKIGNLPPVSSKADVENLIIQLFREYIMDLAEVFRSFNKQETIIAFQRIEVYLEDEYKKEVMLRMAKTLPPKVVFIARALLSVPEASYSTKEKEVFFDKLKKQPDVIRIMLKAWTRAGEKPAVITLNFKEFIKFFAEYQPEEAKEYFTTITVSDYNFIANQLSDNELKNIITQLNLPLSKFFGQVSENSDLIEKTGKKDDELKDRAEVPLHEEEGLQTDPIFIKNAGLVLLSPYLTRFFDLTGLLKNKKEFKGDFTREKACHLMHFLATGLDDGKEYMMTLNKLIAGIPFSYPLKEKIILTDEEKETSEGLLNGVINNWTALKKSSPDNLRGSFLLRDGKLIENDKFWDLRVEEKGFDVLIDKIPWSFKVIRFPWMNKPIHVTWR